MAFIEKIDPVVLNIKLTTKGREELSKGKLSFNSFVLGDSEINYEIIEKGGIQPEDLTQLRPVDKNPNIISYVKRIEDGDYKTTIENVPSVPSKFVNCPETLGFFDISGNTATIKTEPEYLKQPDMMTYLSDCNGDRYLHVYHAPSEMEFPTDGSPTTGDTIMVKWTTPESGESTSGYTINHEHTHPVLFYGVQSVVSGSTIYDPGGMILEVDRDLPNFSGYTGNIVAGCHLFYKNADEGFEKKYSTEYIDDEVLLFLENTQCPTIKFPFWNLSIIHSENIPGIGEQEKKYYHYKTKGMAGFVNYIQNHSPEHKQLGVIHYTNQSPFNTYGEGLHKYTPMLTIPTIMWHKSIETKMGLVLYSDEEEKVIEHTAIPSLNTRYHDLIDEQKNVVGKVFNDLKLFVIEDPELLMVMSYKSNRSWTLPEPDLKVNTSTFLGCPECDFDFDVVGSGDTITITNIEGVIGLVTEDDMIVYVKDSDDNVVYHEKFKDISYGQEISVSGLTYGTYTVTLIDLGSTNCVKHKEVQLGYKLSVQFGENHHDNNTIDISGNTINTTISGSTYGEEPFVVYLPENEEVGLDADDYSYSINGSQMTHSFNKWLKNGVQETTNPLNIIMNQDYIILSSYNTTLIIEN